MADQPPVVLVVDDNEQDVALLQEACRGAGCAAVLRAARSVDEACAYFEGAGPFSDRARHPVPSLVLLDLHMPGKDGFDLLAWLRRRPEDWRRVPVVILTASHDFAQIRRAYDVGANSFLVKPVGFEALVEDMRQVTGYWLRRNRLP